MRTGPRCGSRRRGESAMSAAIEPEDEVSHDWCGHTKRPRSMTLRSQKLAASYEVVMVEEKAEQREAARRCLRELGRLYRELGEEGRATIRAHLNRLMQQEVKRSD